MLLNTQMLSFCKYFGMNVYATQEEGNTLEYCIKTDLLRIQNGNVNAKITGLFGGLICW